jgi:asparagine N-glycosylation enzyme membrane subunit Stt3
MTTLREQTGTYEIILAALAAAGMVLMMISPVAGRVIVLVSLILAALCYVRCSLLVIDFAEEDRCSW